MIEKQIIGVAGSGVICEMPAPHGFLIPAKAGIHSANLGNWAPCILDSRLRGNDRWFVREVIPNDPTSTSLNLLQPREVKAIMEDYGV